MGVRVSPPISGIGKRRVTLVTAHGPFVDFATIVGVSRANEQNEMRLDCSAGCSFKEKAVYRTGGDSMDCAYPDYRMIPSRHAKIAACVRSAT